MLLVSVSRLEERRDKETKTKKNDERKLWASLQEAKEIFDDDDSAKNRRSLGKVRRESATTTSAVLRKFVQKAPPFSFAKVRVFIKF